MPIVHVDLMAGRSPEAIASMMQEVSEVIARTLDAPIGTVRIIVSEMQPHLYGVGGRPWPEIVEERRTATEAE